MAAASYAATTDYAALAKSVAQQDASKTDQTAVAADIAAAVEAAMVADLKGGASDSDITNAINTALGTPGLTTTESNGLSAASSDVATLEQEQSNGTGAFAAGGGTGGGGSTPTPPTPPGSGSSGNVTCTGTNYVCTAG